MFSSEGSQVAQSNLHFTQSATPLSIYPVKQLQGKVVDLLAPVQVKQVVPSVLLQVPHL